VGVPPAANFRNLDDADLQKLQGVIDVNRDLRWKVVQRGFWANGNANLRDYLVDIELYTMKDSAEAIRCPTLLTAAENDPLAKGAQTLFDALKCKKKLVRFTTAEGAGGHCEMMNRSAVNRVALDWLDEVLT
jgi:pimeloyl-ACP methyl ester carboxylesterase